MKRKIIYKLISSDSLSLYLSLSTKALSLLPFLPLLFYLSHSSPTSLSFSFGFYLNFVHLLFERLFRTLSFLYFFFQSLSLILSLSLYLTFALVFLFPSLSVSLSNSYSFSSGYFCFLHRFIRASLCTYSLSMKVIAIY